MDFESVLTAILSPDNGSRLQGEVALTHLLSQNPTQVASNLCMAMQSPSDPVSALAAVLFRRKFFEEGILAKVTPSERQMLRSQCLNTVSTQKSLYFLRRLADVLVNFAVADGWETDLLGYMATWAREESPTIKEFAMNLFELSVEFKPLHNVLSSHAVTVMEILMSALQDRNPEVAVTAAKTVSCFLIGSENESVAMQWAPAIPPILKVLTEVVNTNSHFDGLKYTLESLAELTETYPLIWMDLLNDLISAVNFIAKNRTLDNELRSSAVLVLTNLVTYCPTLAESSPFFLQETIVLGLTLTAELRHISDEQVWSEETDEDDVSRNDMFVLGKDVLCVVSSAVGGPLLLATMSQLIPRYLKSEDWVKQHTGILAIGFIGDGCKQTYKTSMKSLLDLILPFASSPLPRLRWAALTSLGLLTAQFQPLIQTQHFSQVLPAILACLSPGNPTRVLIQSASCLAVYTEGLYLSPNPTATTGFQGYVSQVLQNLSARLGDGLAVGSCPLLEEVLTSIGHIAISLETDFSPYFHSFVPGLRQLMGCPVVTDDQKEVRANCVRCLGAIVMSIGRDRSQLSAVTDLFSLFLSYRQALQTDDPFVSVIELTIPQFAAYLQDDFRPYLESILPDLLAKATAEIEAKLVDAETGTDFNGGKDVHTVHFELRGHGNKQFSVNTSALQGKIAACRVVSRLVSHMGESFSDFLLPTVTALAPLLAYGKNGNVRKFSLKAVVMGVRQCKMRPEIVKSAVEILIPALSNAILFYSHKNTGKVKAVIGASNSILGSCMDLGRLGVGRMEELSKTLSHEVKNALNRKGTRQSDLLKYSNSTLHQDLYQDLCFLEETDEEIVRISMEFLEICLKTFKGEYRRVFQECFQELYFGIFYKERPSDKEIISAVCVLDNYVEYTQDLMVNGGKSFIIENLLGGSAHPNIDIRQSAIYGLGVCAEISSPSLFLTYSEAVLTSVQHMLLDPQSRSPDFTIATDCAVGALGKIAFFHHPELLETWLQYLPIFAEVEEAQTVHRLFLRNLERCWTYPVQTSRVLKEIRDILTVGNRLQIVAKEDLSLLHRADSSVYNHSR